MSFPIIFSSHWIVQQNFHPEVKILLQGLFNFFHENAELFGEDDVFVADNEYLALGIHFFCKRVQAVAAKLYVCGIFKRTEYDAYVANYTNCQKLIADLQPREVRKILETMAIGLSEFFVRIDQCAQEKPHDLYDEINNNKTLSFTYDNFLEIAGSVAAGGFYLMNRQKSYFTPSNCKLHVSTAIAETEKMFNAISGFLWRYFNKFKVIDKNGLLEEAGFNALRFSSGGQVTIRLYNKLSVSKLEKILSRMNLRLKQKGVTVGRLESDAPTAYDHISLRYDIVFGDYIPASITGKNNNPICEITQFNQIVETPDTPFSPSTHFNQFNLSDSHRICCAIKFTIAAYLQNIFTQESMPDIIKKTDQQSWMAAIIPERKQDVACIEDVEYLYRINCYIEDIVFVILSPDFLSCYTGGNQMLREFFKAIDHAIKQQSCNHNGKDFAIYYAEKSLEQGNHNPDDFMTALIFLMNNKALKPGKMLFLIKEWMSTGVISYPADSDVTMLIQVMQICEVLEQPCCDLSALGQLLDHISHCYQSNLSPSSEQIEARKLVRIFNLITADSEKHQYGSSCKCALISFVQKFNAWSIDDFFIKLYSKLPRHMAMN